MVLKTEIKTKEGVVLMTKKKENMYDYTFEVGDIFIPQYNSMMTKSHLAVVEGKNKTIVNHKLKCIVKDYNNNESIYVSLTPSQAKTLIKKIDDKVLLNQHLFIAYSYEDADKNQWVGIGVKGNSVKAKTFEDFGNEAEESQEVKE